MNDRSDASSSASSATSGEAGTSSPLPDGGQSELRALARRAIDSGQIPSSRAEHTWGGFGNHAVCAICAKPVRPEDPEIELEFGSNGSTRSYHLHVPCCTAWELECHRLRGGRGAPVETPVGAERGLPAAAHGGTIRARERDPAKERGPGK